MIKKTLVIMGTHWKGLRDFDWKRRDVEIWMFNEAPNVKDKQGKLIYRQPDAFFQLHHEAIWRNPKNRSDKEYYKWLASGKTPTVYMQKHFKEVPKSVEYPLDQVLKLTKNITTIVDGKEKSLKYFSSTPDFAFALAAYLWKKGKRYKQVEVYGIELEMESEYVHQRMGFGFWIGYLSALGIPVRVYSSVFNEPIYGYEGDLAVSSGDLERRAQDLKKELGNDKEKYSDEAGIFLESIKGLNYKDSSSEIEKNLNELTKRNEKAGILNGKIKEAERYKEKAIVMEKVSGASVFSPGEFDDMRKNYTKMYEQIRMEISISNAKIAEHVKKLINLKKGSAKRIRAVDEFGQMIAELMNKNMQLFHLVGGAQENQYYINSYRQSIKTFERSKD